jgi:hypothetical protein
MDHWWANQHVNLGDKEKSDVEDYTGCIPLLLDKAVVNGEIKLGCRYLDKLFFQVRSFEKDLRTRCRDDQGELKRYILLPFYPHNFANVFRHQAYMRAVISLGPVPDTSEDIPHLVDHRYFYDQFDPELEDSVGCYSCGLARDAVSSMLLSSNVLLADVDFLQSLDKYIDNASVTGFMVEKAILSSISLYGANIIASETNRSMVVKSHKSRIQSLYPRKGDLVLHLPGAFNFRTVDGIIVRKVDDGEPKSRLLVFPLQITVAKTHKDSHAAFFKDWKRWSQDLGEFDVVIEFVWIVEKERDPEDYPRSTKWPAHKERFISLSQVNTLIGDLYDKAKTRQRIRNGVLLNEDFGLSIIGRSREPEADGPSAAAGKRSGKQQGESGQD